MEGQTDGPTGGLTSDDDDCDSSSISERRITAVDINEKCIVSCGECSSTMRAVLRNILRAIIEVLSTAKIASCWLVVDDMI